MSPVQAILRHNEGLSSDDEMPGQDMAGLSKVIDSYADPGCLSRIRIFSIPDPHQNIVSILTQKIVSKLSEIWSGLFIPDPDFLPIPDPESKRNRIRIRNTGTSHPASRSDLRFQTIRDPNNFIIAIFSFLGKTAKQIYWYSEH